MLPQRTRKEAEEEEEQGRQIRDDEFSYRKREKEKKREVYAKNASLHSFSPSPYYYFIKQLSYLIDFSKSTKHPFILHEFNMKILLPSNVTSIVL